MARESSKLTPKKKMAAGLWALGATKAAIAGRLGVNPNTITEWLEEPEVLAVADKYLEESCRSSFDGLFKGAVGEAINLLLEVMSSPEEKTNDRLKAAQEILDRALGKPEQKTSIETNLLSEFMTKVEMMRGSSAKLIEAKPADDVDEFIEDLIPEGVGGVVGVRARDAKDDDDWGEED